jgi:threonine/homoserine/homoserine lactone efflux protein
MLLETWIPFVVATLVFAFMPGPAILYMSAQTLAYGQRAGLMAALGIHLGCYIHIAAASAGLAALLHHAPVLYSFLRLAGAFYMLWLGGRMMFASVAHDATEIPSRHRRVLRDSIVVEIVNGAFSLGDLASVAIASFASPRISSSGFADWIPRVSGGVLVGLSAAIMMHFI